MKKTVRSCGGVKPDTQDDVKSPAQIEAEQAQEHTGTIQGVRYVTDRLTPSSNPTIE
jgi:hypothetical protein